MAKKNSFEELMKGIDWNRYLPAIVGIMQPVVIFGAWLAFSKMDNRADALSKLITLAEPIPTLDLNIPPPVVLASLYHSVDELADVIEQVIEFIEDLEIPSAKEIIKEIKDELTDPIVEGVEEILPDNPAFKKALADCVIKAKDDLGIAYWVLGPAQIQLCMLRKGFKVSLKYILGKLFG